jgi:hypothetical protein
MVASVRASGLTASGLAFVSCRVAVASPGRGSNCRPKLTEGSAKPVSAAQGTTRRSWMSRKLSVTAMRASSHSRPQNWCWRTMVISSGYFSRR